MSFAGLPVSTGMKLLLTSAGVKNPSIHDALVDLLGKPIAESERALHPDRDVRAPLVRPRAKAWQFIAGQSADAHGRAGLEVRGRARADRAAQHRRGALGPAGPRDRRAARGRRRRPVPVPLDAGVRAGRPPAVAARDGLGGPERREHGDDARIGEDFIGWQPPAGDDSTLGLVDFSIFPHLDHEDLPDNSMAERGEVGRRLRRLRRTRSTTRPRSWWSTAPSRSSPRGTGGSSRPRHRRRRGGCCVSESAGVGSRHPYRQEAFMSTTSVLPDVGIELREGYADVGDDVKLHYVEAGEGPLVVLLHGFPEFWFGWRGQIAPLAAAGFRVVAPDTRGYNLSSQARRLQGLRRRPARGRHPRPDPRARRGVRDSWPVTIGAARSPGRSR